MGAGGDVEENHFVGSLRVVAQGQFNGVADVFESALFGSAELDTAGDFSIVDVEAGNNALGEHEKSEVAVRFRLGGRARHGRGS
ncbi:MAG: hypothetical protein RLZZ399_2408 [Verrucomicrobiota bacterium]